MGRSAGQGPGGDREPTASVLAQALRPVRIVLAALCLVLLLAQEAGSGSGPFDDWSAVVAAVAGLDVVVNVVALTRRGRHRLSGRRVGIAQVVLDAVLALAALSLLDAATTPLAWIALVLPVAGTLAVGGTAAATGAWVAVGAVYLVLTLRSDAAASSTAALRLALQQLAAVAVVALPASYAAARLRDDLDGAAEARQLADRRAADLRRVAATVRSQSLAPDPDTVLDLAVACAAALGATRVDVLEEATPGGAWELRRSVGPRAGPPPDALSLPDRAVAAGRSIVVDVAAPAAGSAAAVRTAGYGEALSSRGYRSAVAVPLWEHDGRWTVVRACTPTALSAGSSLVEAMEVLAAQTDASHRIAHTLRDLEQWSARLAHEASHDALTGLPNRAHLVGTLEHALADSVAGGPPVAVLFCDLDGFKAVNDTLGHEAGDAVLVAFADRVRAAVGDRDLVARLAGDEFVVVLDVSAGPERSTNVAEHLCAVTAAPVATPAGTARFGVSVGIHVAAAGDTVDEVLAAADRAMYAAKRSGGGRVRSGLAGRDR